MTRDIRICRLHGKGDLRLETLTPDEPGPGEVAVAIGAGGICGSDLHYFQHGGIGTIRVREPIILGHEAAGLVAALGEGVTGLSVGDLVAVNPSHPCGDCPFCRAGMRNQCENMVFLGSAMYLPHAQGLFRDQVVVGAAQCHRVTGGVGAAEAACAEPLAVCLHAASLAGNLSGARVLVTGAGPIGAFCTAAAAAAGACEIVVTDLQDVPLNVASRMGATRTVNVARNAGELDDLSAGKGRMDVAFECSAAAPALEQAVACLRPRGRLVQVGSAGPTEVPLNQIVGKEIELHGSFRFDAEFAQAVAAIGSRRIDVRPAITGAYGLDEASAAFDAAADRSRSVKVHIRFDDI